MKKLGFPRMHKEENEKRDFLPSFFGMLKNENAVFYLEEEYGSAMGFTYKDYLNENNKIIFVSNKECYSKDIVIVLRSPEFEEIDYMKKGSILLSMLHYPTRSKRVEKLKEKGIYGVSMDDIKNDFLERIVVNYEGTSGNGMNLAFKELSKTMTNFYVKDKEPITVSIMGMGRIGLTAAKYAGKYGSYELNSKMKEIGAKGVIVKMLPRNITTDKLEMIRILKKTDILVDATTRDDTNEYIVYNYMLDCLKNHSIILDLTADPYLTGMNSIQVKAIEGIPTGNLDKMVFYPSDDEYKKIPESVDSLNRRVVVSCNAWPGVEAQKCMNLYGKQLIYIVQNLIKSSIDDFKICSEDYFNRAIYRASIEYFNESVNNTGKDFEDVVI